MSQRNRQSDEFGGVFIYIFIGVILFAALAFTFSKSMTGTNTSVISSGKDQVSASEIISYANSISKAVNKLTIKGCSERQISFERDSSSDYDNGDAPSDLSCNIFSPGKGGILWQEPPSGSNNGSSWIFTDTRVGNFSGTRNLGTSNSDMVMILPNITKPLCAALNVQTSNPEPWESGGAYNTYLFVGDYETSPATTINMNAATAPTAGCFCDSPSDCNNSSATFHFYQVLLVR